MTENSSMSAIKQVRALLLAASHMREAREACTHLTGLTGASVELRYAIYTGITVTYARSFLHADGVSALPASLSKFPEEQTHGKLHLALVEARNTIYAHHAATDGLTDRMELVASSQNGRVEVRVDVGRRELLMEYLPAIDTLCKYQLARINAEWISRFQHLFGPKKFEPGTYLLTDEAPYFVEKPGSN